ncbi:hypothetical protein HYDPIDRAFT_116015 [Hydnomerulius pinastri MD-312]|uniref:Unplaced genomic scaffold scaffold_29, whole genome shotgun sequence n=1 Tax=Hydnomerulius pinastri MD-312 TaxID=994086 RepID=A0A0C9VTH8_9AGAM|nr:hypothetical protein HYDPIDRAFT_116015 [Hydnomerulius pinastri MD-312]
MHFNYQTRVDNIKRVLDVTLSRLERNRRSSRFLTDAQSEVFRGRVRDLHKEYSTLRHQKGSWVCYLLSPWSSNNPWTRLKKLEENSQFLFHDLEVRSPPTLQVHLTDFLPLQDAENTYRVNALRIPNGSAIPISDDTTTTAQSAPLTQSQHHSQPHPASAPMGSGWMEEMSQIIIVANRTSQLTGTVQNIIGGIGGMGHATLIGNAAGGGEGPSHNPGT